MDELFSSLALQTVQLVGKAAFGAAGTLALKRVSDYVGHAQHAPEPQAKLERLLSRFEARLRIVTPAIDLVEIIAARGRSTLEGALPLTHSLRRDILALSTSLPSATSPRKSDGLASLFRSSNTQTHPESESTVVTELQALLEKIDDAVPFLNLALTTSGAHLGGTLPEGISPARLMQASSVLARAPAGSRVGQPFVLRLYSLFVASVRPKSRHDFTWKEEFVKCRLCLWRQTQGLAYELRILEDTNDGRYHSEEPQANVVEWAADMGDGVGVGGKSVVIPLDRVASLYYTSAGSLLNIEDSTSPVLVLSVRPDPPAEDPLQNMAEFGKLDSSVRWYALEVAATDNDEDSGTDSDSSEADSNADLSEEDEKLAQTFDQLCSVTYESSSGETSDSPKTPPTTLGDELLRPLDFLVHEWNMCTLSLLEYMIRLASVEMTEQISHLEVPDEKLRLYLQATTGSDSKEEGVPASKKSTVGTPTRSRRTPVSTLGTPL
ncbi:Ran-specific GTPase-activating protein 30 [Coemansia aciculifera]|uniref:Ran-specific GTPase-activating protein 30 n=1 Tax=Coemansia aciculifera TaxID=417176 RepID=A0A9W8ITF8_9FUNG|nr:Ran-specific GTPase-activating protein 30 [Coemansia aciculifera]